MNNEVENRLTKLEECCNWYKSRIHSLEEQLRDHITRMERQMHPPLSAKAEEKEDESAQFDFQMFKREIQQRKEHLVKQLDGVLKSVNLSDTKHPPEWGTTKLDEIYRNSYKNLNFELLDQLYELYNAIKHRASKYHIDGNSSIAKKCMIEAEIIFDELKKYEQLLEETWIKLNTLRVPDALDGANITVSGQAKQLSISANGLVIGIPSANWQSYENLPSYLTGLVATTSINNGAVSFTFAVPTLSYLLRSDEWVPVSLTGWSVVGKGKYITGYDNINVYSQVLPAGTFTTSDYSAMYMFTPAPAHAPLFSHPSGYKSYLKGGKRKTRKNKNLHTI
jgi:hypothetical protein